MHFFQLKNECVACFLKIPKSKNFYWNLLIFFSSKMNVWHAFWKIVHVWHAFWSCFLKNRPCVTCFLKKNRPGFLDFFKKLEIFHFIFLKLDFFSIWQVDTFFMYVENYFPNTSFIYLLDHNTLIQNIPFFYYFFYYFIFYFLFPSIHYFITFYWYYKI